MGRWKGAPSFPAAGHELQIGERSRQFSLKTPMTRSRLQLGRSASPQQGGDGGSGEPSKTGYPWISRLGHAPPPHPASQAHSQQHGINAHSTPVQPRRLRIGRWGNVLAVRLPQALSNLLRLQLGDDLELQLLPSGQLLLTPTPRRSRLALCEALQTAADQ